MTDSNQNTALEIDYDLLAEKIAIELSKEQQDRMLTKNEVCERLGNISEATLYRRISANKFPAPEKDGRTPMWQKSIVDQHFVERKAA